MEDKPVGRVADVERLLQVLALLRDNAGDWVPAARLRDNVTGYRESPSEDARVKMIQRDLASLRDLGFDIDGETQEGSPARYRLKPTPWRVPLALDQTEERLLAWVMAATGAVRGSTRILDSSLPPVERGSRFSSLLGAVPAPLDVVHQALAAGRRLRILHGGDEKQIEPAQLTVQQGRWFLIARYPGSDRFYGFRLDRLEVLELGDPVTETLDPPADPLTVIDNTAWAQHEPIDVELRCARADEEPVREFFRRAEVSYDGEELVLRMPVSNTDALVDRVLRFGGVVRVTAPVDVVAMVRARAEAFVEAVS